LTRDVEDADLFEESVIIMLNMENFRENIKHYRELKGWNISQCAKQIGISKPYLWQLEHGSG
jgi:DNA-binding XRE family transcriptional regulator